MPISYHQWVWEREAHSDLSMVEVYRPCAGGLSAVILSKHQIQPEYGESRLTRDGTVEPVSRNQISGTKEGQRKNEKIIFPVQLTMMSRIDSLLPLNASKPSRKASTLRGVKSKFVKTYSRCMSSCPLYYY